MDVNNGVFTHVAGTDGISSPPINDHTNGQVHGQPNGHVNGQVNGHANGHTNGNVNGHINSQFNGQVENYKNSALNDKTRASNSVPESIAICGLALRLPKGIRDAEGFWDVLQNGEDMRGPIPSDRYNAKGFNNALGKKGAIITKYGYFLDEDLSCLDTSFFSMAKQELEKTDPQQRQILEVTRECLESAGETDYRGKLIGCYVGTFGDDWLHSQSKDAQYTGGYNLSGDLMIANRVSYEYDLKGPSMVIKTGCSASLVGLHEACRALQSGDCTAAIVAGTSLIMGPTTTAAMTQEGIISPEGSCKTFDAKADGFARAEAINAVYIKRLDDAIRDNNPIRAVIRNTGTNSDGRSQGLMAPNGKSQEALMRRVYSEAGLNPRDTAFVECHGTGTATGDPIETAAVGNVFGERGVFIGSVKPNVGHSEGASGITSLIKAVLALENKTIPPNIKFTTPNPKIPFNGKKLRVPVSATPWPTDRAERISVNSFGIGGSNAHVIVDSGDQVRPDSVDAAAGLLRDTPQLLVFSANTQESLRRQVSHCKEYLKLHPERLIDLSYTLSQRREHLLHRAFSVVGAQPVTNTSSYTKLPANVPRIVMIFSGQGAQWPGMGKDLIQNDPGFQEDIRAMDDILQSLNYPPHWKVEDELQKPIKTSQLHRAEMAQPLCTAIQIALVNSLDRCGIRPSAVVGHSSGEIAAAYATGALSMSEAMIVSYYRGYVTKHQKMVGGMAAIGLNPNAAAAFLKDGLVIACENSPNNATISGDLYRLQEVIEIIKERRPDVLARQLKVDMAYHSHHMKPLALEYISLVQAEIEANNIIRNDPQIPFFSTVTEGVIDKSKMLGPEYWADNLTSPVRFHAAVSKLLSQESRNVFLEIGPHSTLAGPLREICAEARTPCLYIPTMLRSNHCVESFLSAIGQLYQQGIAAKFESLTPVANVLPDLPPYPWDHTVSHWYESRLSRDWRFRSVGHHALLGQQILESTSLDPCWRVVLDLEDEPWLYDHKVRDDVVFPFAGYVAMAGEAIRQITGIELGYSVRHVVAHTALVLTESKPVEVVTTLRRHKLTDSTDSDFYHFVISSYSGSAWINNCEGRVRANEKAPESSSQSDVLPRKVLPSRWYEIMARVGLVYGPEFQGITALSSSATTKLAAADITNSTARQEAPFLFHPAAIDACLQLALAALAQGAGRNFTQLCVPTLIEELDISRSALNMKAKAWSSNDGKDIGIDCVADGKIALRLRGARLSPLEDDKAIVSADRHAAARLEWCPDFDFIDIPPLFSPPVADNDIKQLLEEMALLCLLESAERLKDLSTEQPHFEKFRDWLQREIRRAESGTYPIVQEAATYVKLPRSERLKMIQQRYRALSSTPSIGLVATGIMRICENAEGLFTGKVDTLDLLMQDNVLTEIYNAVSFGFGDFVRMLSNTKPNLRILEVGAGTGGTTELILQDLVSSGGNPSYSVYTFTDISAGFFPQARERFAYAPNMDYKVFDISQSPFEQGFEAASYDLILAPNVVHATPNLQDTLRNLRPLLRPHGHLVLSEVCAVARAPGYVFGNFSGWWLGEADDRRYEPYVNVDRWDRELRAAGFTGVDTAVLDAEEPYQYCAAIVTQPKPQESEADNRSITVLCEQQEQGISQSLIFYFKQAGFAVSIVKFGEPLPQDQDIISTLDLETPFFENITKERFSAFQQLLRHHKSQKLLWLMPPTQVRCLDPRSAQTIGMFRVVRAELAIPFMTLEIDPTETDFSNLVMKVFHKVRTREDTDKIAPDKEFAVDRGVIKIGRYEPFSLEKEVCEKSATHLNHVVKTLEIAKPGLLETLRWTEGSIPSIIENNQVEIETRAVGLNFRDIMVSMGVLSFGSKSPPLGLEVAGVVRRIGSNVRHVAVGDRVCAVATEGCFSTSALFMASLVVKIPDSLDFEEAATMPSCFTTAVQSLIDVGQLVKGQSVLVHSACGGVGLAAIQLCKMIKAEIFATVGNEEKRQYLIENFDIPKNHIFNSRNESFLPDLMRETAGRGVDIVLNSLSGELLHASWKCVAQFGKLVELGKRDLVGYGRLDLEPFLANRSYCCVDLAHSMKERPEAVGRVMARWVEMYKHGDIRPIRPMALFNASEIEQSFRYLQKGDHIGKAVIKMPEDASSIQSTPRATPLTLDPEAAYLLTGGLGGLGRSIATWMVENGARYLIFLSRSARLGDGNAEFFTELETMGCTVCAVAGQVQDVVALHDVISKAPRPIKGILHLAMVLRDAPILDLTYDEWTTAVAPKVDGAWNLHKAFLNHSLDFFIMTSSLVTLIDQPGQSNYAAANTFLESFCQYRHTLGLPASVLGVCPIDDIGFVAENPAIRKKLKSQGLYFLPERELLDYVELAILNSHHNHRISADPAAPWKNSNHLIMGLRSEVHLEDPNCQASWRRDRRMGMYHNIRNTTAGDTSTNTNALKNFLSRVADDSRILDEKASAEYLALEIGQRVFKFMMKPEEDIDISLSLTQIGMDSLMAIELRRWWKQAFGLDVSVLEIMGSGALKELGNLAAKGLRKKLGESK